MVGDREATVKPGLSVNTFYLDTVFTNPEFTQFTFRGEILYNQVTLPEFEGGRGGLERGSWGKQK